MTIQNLPVHNPTGLWDFVPLRLLGLCPVIFCTVGLCTGRFVLWDSDRGAGAAKDLNKDASDESDH